LTECSDLSGGDRSFDGWQERARGIHQQE
jgi:hypothetical protein